MDLYVHPLVEIVRVDGLMAHALNVVDVALSTARDRGVYTEIGLVTRNERQIRALRRRSIHTLNESRKELQPLYDVLRRSSAIAHGATLAINRLQHLKLDDWVMHYVIQAGRASIECPPTDGVLRQTIHDVAAHPPVPPPLLNLNGSSDTPADFTRLLWLNGLNMAIDEHLPVRDLTAWLTKNYPEKGTADMLLGLSRLMFDPTLEVVFKGNKHRTYRTRDGELEATTIYITKT
jgi:hypothetical protein